MIAPEASSPPARSRLQIWAERLQWLGRRGLVVVLLGIGGLWLHEFTVDMNAHQNWKLKVMFGLVPLGLASAVTQAVAWVLAWLGRRRN